MNDTFETTSPTQAEKPRGAQFELNPEMTDLVDSLKTKTGASTRAEVVRRALSYFSEMLREIERGGKVEIVEPNGDRYRVKLF